MKYSQLTREKRYQIYGLLKEGFTQKAIAKNIGCHPSTISRELKRNKGKRGYRAKQASNFSEMRKKTAFKYVKLTHEVQGWIRQLINQDLSPEQVGRYLRSHKVIRLHHETVYQFIYRDKAQGGDLYKHLRIANKPYRKRYGETFARVELNKTATLMPSPIHVI